MPCLSSHFPIVFAFFIHVCELCLRFYWVHWGGPIALTGRLPECIGTPPPGGGGSASRPGARLVSTGRTGQQGTANRESGMHRSTFPVRCSLFMIAQLAGFGTWRKPPFGYYHAIVADLLGGNCFRPGCRHGYSSFTILQAWVSNSSHGWFCCPNRHRIY